MSKYKAEWKEFDLNEDFWTEVLVGRKIESLGPSEKNIKAGVPSWALSSEIVLDSGEKVWFSDGTVFPRNIISKTISALEWGDGGIRNLVLDDDGLIILPVRGWRICIED